MEYEARKAPMTFRGSMLSTVRDHREQIAKFQNELSISSFSKLKEDKSSSSLDLPSETDDPIRRQILMGAASLDRTTQMVLSSTQVALETEAVGEEIINDLGSQRETLQRTRTRLAETEADLSRSRRILRRIYLGVIQNKICLIFLIIIQIVIIIFILYWKFLRKS
uniref:Vesicle transport through interaction with tSNAREs 1B [Heterocephalus glaber] n=1 Tax=Lepeophtheirus salmonis TaxID=72036 RepID=A0A0K2TPM6_LEPSM